MNIGDYVRTKEGNIYKIGQLGYNNETFLSTNDEGWYEVYKSSPNIIDLIEVGDYVNDCMVINKKDDIIQIIQLIIPFDLKEKDIKSIVTREMFESMKYKVGE